MSVKKSVNALKYFDFGKDCFVIDGELFPAYHGEQVVASAVADITFAAYSPATGAYFACTPTAILFSSDGNSFSQQPFVISTNPFMIEYISGDKPRAAIVSGNTAAEYCDGIITFKALAQSLSCGIVHRDRLFAVDGENALVLRWSGADGVFDDSAGLFEKGKLTLDAHRGKILNLLVFGGKLVAVREYGVTLISAQGVPQKFCVEVTDTDCDKIFKNTACVSDGKLVFCSQSGIKIFDGSKITRVQTHFDFDLPDGAAQCDGKYFLSCRSKKLNRRVILCVELGGGRRCVTDRAASAVFSDGKACFWNAAGLNRLADGARYYFKSDKIDFGTGGVKTVTKIELAEQCDLKLSNGTLTRVFTAARGVVRPRLRGTSFTVEVEGESPLKFLDVTAEVCNEI